ncbi:hypothetical protein [Nocardioides currus]|uniref:Uncharacterized protein n=1 Tax=Nocardioides currus TaxID=2133958 RepID=A0A2R7YVN5_9ACTN|nr:hypothetical protein [Nocardioides currus]PUA80126.1 hypothetical protein C7S10_16425 [Nocardioides currus]
MTVKDRRPSQAAFATATFTETRRVGGEWRQVPASRVHAKTMGSTVTLCGQSTLSWFKFWDIAFVTVQSDRCPQCTDALAQRFAEARRR